MKKIKGWRGEAQVWLRVRFFFFLLQTNTAAAALQIRLVENTWPTYRYGEKKPKKQASNEVETALATRFATHVPVCLCTGCFLNAHHYSVYIAEFRVLLKRVCRVVCVVYRHALLNEVISRGTGDASRAVGMT